MTGQVRLRVARLLAAGAAGAALLLAGCADEPARSAGASGVGAPSWSGTGNGHRAEGWQPGDQGSWEEQRRRRAQMQNEYARIGGAS
jgi:hypothetical protein